VSPQGEVPSLFTSQLQRPIRLEHREAWLVQLSPFYELSQIRRYRPSVLQNKLFVITPRHRGETIVLPLDTVVYVYVLGINLAELENIQQLQMHKVTLLRWGGLASQPHLLRNNIPTALHPCFDWQLNELYLEGAMSI